MKNRYLAVCFIFLAFFLAGCQTLPRCSEFSQTVEGIKIDYEIVGEYSMVSFPVDFDEIEIVCFPDENTKMKDGEFHTKYAADFARESGAFVVFDSSPFEVESVLQHLFTRRKLVGVHKSNGVLLNPENEYFSALAARKGTLEIMPRQDSKRISEFDYAFGGFFAGVQNGKLVNIDDETKDIRVAVGLTENADRIFIITGKKLTIDRTSQILLNAGCHNAMHFDGGSSSQLVVGGVSLNGPCVPPGGLVGFRKKQPF